MSWLIFAIAARFLWACTNIIDQYVVRYVQGQSALATIMMEHFMILPLSLILVMAGVSLPSSPTTVFWLFLGALINVGALVPYFLALKNDEAHNAVPLMELTPVFLTLLAWIFFGDVLTRILLLGACLVIGAGFLFAWDFRSGRIRLKTALLVGACSLGWAFYQLLLRAAAPHESPWSIVLAVSVGYIVNSIFMFAILPRQRGLIIQSMRKSKGLILAITCGEELVAMSATICLVFAFALAPKAGQVAALSSAQPIFVMIISAALGLLLPKHCPRLLWNREMKIKCLLLLVIAGGIVLLKTN